MVLAGKKRILNLEVIYVRALVLMSENHDFDFEKYLSYELAPFSNFTI